jgi:predicted nucleic acid-binding protein
MEANSQKRLSLDTNVLFDLADGQDFAHDFRETYQRKGYALVISPTVVAELSFLRDHGDGEERRLASLSLARLASWDVQVHPLAGVQLDLARRFAAALVDRALLPENEPNDALILAEAAVAGISLVVSSDNHLLGIDPDSLREACAEAHLNPVFPVSPRRLLRALR